MATLASLSTPRVRDSANWKIEVKLTHLNKKINGACTNSFYRGLKNDLESPFVFQLVTFHLSEGVSIF